MAELPPNVNWLEEAEEKCRTGKRIFIPMGTTAYVVRVAEYDPEIHGEPEVLEEPTDEPVLTDGGEDG